MSEPPKKIQDRVEELRATFAAALADRVSAFEAAAKGVDPSSSQAEIRSALTTLSALSHKLAGSAGVLGFTRLGRSAGELHLTCDMFLDSKSDISTKQCAEVCKLLDAIKSSAISEVESIVLGRPSSA